MANSHSLHDNSRYIALAANDQMRLVRVDSTTRQHDLTVRDDPGIGQETC